MTKRITIEDLAAMVARGFEKTATKDDLNELRSDLTQTIYKEVGRIDRRLDQMAFRSELQNVEKRVTRLERKSA